MIFSVFRMGEDEKDMAMATIEGAPERLGHGPQRGERAPRIGPWRLQMMRGAARREVGRRRLTEMAPWIGEGLISPIRWTVPLRNPVALALLCSVMVHPHSPRVLAPYGREA